MRMYVCFVQHTINPVFCVNEFAIQRIRREEANEIDNICFAFVIVVVVVV